MLDAKTLSGPPPVTARAADAPTADPWARSGLGHPVMFVILGGVLVIGALVGTGLYLGQAEAGPGRIRGVETSPVPATTAPLPVPEPAATSNPPVAPPSATEATPTPATAATAPNATAAAPPAPPPPPPPPPPVSNDRPVTVQTPPADSRPRALAAGSAAPSRATPAGSASSAATGKAATPKQPVRDDARPRDGAPNGAAVLDQLEREVDLLTVRVDAVNNGLGHLQQEQARQGLGLRGDMAARQSSMNLNISRAQEAVSHRDAARAQRYRDAAEADIEALRNSAAALTACPRSGRTPAARSIPSARYAVDLAAVVHDVEEKAPGHRRRGALTAEKVEAPSHAHGQRCQRRMIRRLPVVGLAQFLHRRAAARLPHDGAGRARR
jgi:hypothetical protein